MNIKTELKERIVSIPYGKKVLDTPKVVLSALLSFTFNISYALFCMAYGIGFGSIWFLFMFGFHFVLAVMKLCVVMAFAQSTRSEDKGREYFYLKFLGILFMFFPIGILVMEFMGISSCENQQGEILMIAIAAYVFTKLGFMIARLIRTKGDRTSFSFIAKSVGGAELAISILNLQRSMIMTFGKNSAVDTVIWENIILAAVVCVFIATLGILALIRK